tara:strand:+ start:641 stop:1054 length:414 start_codon:yes stop_codon:yes gene_type:complete
MEPFDNDPIQQYDPDQYEQYGSHGSYNSDAINSEILSIAGGMLATSLLIVSCRIICSTIKLTYKDYREKRKIKNLLKQRIILSDENNLSDCPICLDSFHRNSPIIILLCNHKFHEQCIIGWLNKDNNSCPLCREDII